MAAGQQISAEHTLRRIQQIQTITIGWMSVEAGVSLWAAWRARSPALFAFGGDSGIELLSAIVVLWRFRKHLADEVAERRASRIAGILLLALAVLIVVSSALTLLGYSEPKLSYLGIAVLVAAGILMPWLARAEATVVLGDAKRRAACGRRGIYAVRLSFLDRVDRTRSACLPRRGMGRSCRRFGDYPSRCLGRSGNLAGQSLRLPLALAIQMLSAL